MEIAAEHILMIFLVFLGLSKRYGWVMVLSGIGAIGLAVQLVSDEGLIYGAPFVGIGFCMVIVGAFRGNKTGVK